jgi:hypothetical protein
VNRLQRVIAQQKAKYVELQESQRARREVPWLHFSDPTGIPAEKISDKSHEAKKKRAFTHVLLDGHVRIFASYFYW